MRHKINICQISAFYPPALGGLESVAQKIAAGLAALGHPLTVITSDRRTPGALREEKIGDLLVKRLRSVEIAHTALIPGLALALWRIPKPAIFHLHLAQAYVPEIVWLISKLRRIPYIVHFHIDAEPSGPLGFLFVWWKRWVQPLIIRGAARVITLSEEQSQMIKTRYGLNDERIRFIGNGVSAEFFALGREEKDFHKPLRLLFVGRLTSQKRPERLIKALAQVASSVNLELVGDGEDRENLKEMAQGLGLKNICFRGRLEGSELLEAYRQADVFVLPSDKEGMPLVLLEAMAAGLPIIGSDVIGIRELVSGVGLLVKDPSAAGFAMAIDSLANDKGKLRELSHLSREKARPYSWDILLKKLEQTYEEIGL